MQIGSKSKFAAYLSAVLIVLISVFRHSDQNRRRPVWKFQDFNRGLLEQSGKQSRKKRAIDKLKSVTQKSKKNKGEYYLGERLFLTCTIEHRGAPESPRSTSDGFANFVVDGERLVLNRVPTELFMQEEGIVAYDGRFFSLPAMFPRRAKRELTVKDDPQGIEKETLVLSSEYIPPVIEVTKEGSSVEVLVEEERKFVEPKQSREIELDAREIEIQDQNGLNSFAEVQPVVLIHNYGWLDVYGSPEKGLLPLDSEDLYTKRRTEAILENSEDEVEIDRDNDLLIIP